MLTKAGKTKKKKKKCQAETIQRRGGKTEVRERRWILKFGGEKSQFFFFFFHPVSICWLKLDIYLDMAETAPIQPVFKLKQNKSISILT